MKLHMLSFVDNVLADEYHSVPATVTNLDDVYRYAGDRRATCCELLCLLRNSLNQV